MALDCSPQCIVVDFHRTSTRRNPMRSLLLLLLLHLSSQLSLSSPSPAPTGKNLRGAYAVEDILRRAETLRAPPSVQVAAAQGVLLRLLPNHTSSFLLKVIPKGLCERFSCFRIDNAVNSSLNGPEIVIKGSTAVEVSFGLHWYLKYWCGAHISWDKTGGVQVGTVPSPGSLPRVEGKGLKVERPVPWNYYQNVVTSSYSFVWWDWKRWEKEIDWMALQGVNLPLAFTGQEAIWQKVFKNFNVENKDLGSFFGGPAFLAWARMGNLHGWGGPLSQHWLDQQLSLQKLILPRMIELGMTPVLPAFSGNVPAIFRKMFSTANITKLSNWNTVNGDPRWCCTYLLDPSDPLFFEIGRAFIKKQIKEYGDITNIYSCDTFNENLPPTNDPKYISSLGAAVYDAMAKGDNDAIWLMQGWLFSSDAKFWKPPQMKALLHSVPVGKMIVLDLFADVKPVWKTSSQFYGVPYVWCLLHNFGGNIEMYGILDAISSGPVDARVSLNSTMVGVGMCMEGTEQNPVVYEMMPEMAFRSQLFQIEGWLKSYSLRRYGQANHQIEEAWKILYHTIYNCTDGIADHNKDFIVQFPDSSPSLEGPQVLHISENKKNRFSLLESSSQVPHLWYSTKEVVKALELFLDAGSSLAEIPTFRYDLVDLTRQVLAKLSNQVYRDAINAYRQNDADELILQTQKFTELIEDLDTLLATDENFLLGTWLESAKKLAANKEDKRQARILRCMEDHSPKNLPILSAKLYEWNARTQITMWFDNTETNQSQLHDYANRFWSGLLKSYYLPRASTYFSSLLASLKDNKSFQVEKWRRDWISYSNTWQEGEELYPVKAEGDALSIAKALFVKYYSKIDDRTEDSW